MSKLQEMMKERGFIDYDVIEFGESVIQEILQLLDPSDDLTSMNEEAGRYAAMQMITNHFGVQYVKKIKRR